MWKCSSSHMSFSHGKWREIFVRVTPFHLTRQSESSRRKRGTASLVRNEKNFSNLQSTVKETRRLFCPPQSVPHYTVSFLTQSLLGAVKITGAWISISGAQLTCISMSIWYVHYKTTTIEFQFEPMNSQNHGDIVQVWGFEFNGHEC